MRHNNDVSKLGRTSAHRRALLRNLVTEFFRRERIETTIPKAKALQRVAEKMVTLAKRGDLHARRQALEWFMDESVCKKLFEVQVEQFKGRQGGYTRILRLGFRPGDSAPIGLIELVGSEHKFVVAPKKGPKEKGKEKAAPKEKKAAAPKEKAVKEKAAPKEKKAAAPKEKAVKEKAAPKAKKAAAPKAAAPKAAKKATGEKG